MNTPDRLALATASAIANRLTWPQNLQVAFRSTGRGQPQSLAGGAAGIALLHIERARTGHGEWNTAHAWLAAAARGDLSAGPNASMFFGAPTLAFVTHAAVDRPEKYERALAALNTSTITLTRRRLDDANARIDRGDRPALAEFDLLRGIAGLGSYHLQRNPHDDVTGAVLAYLVRLTEPLTRRVDGLPGWWTDFAPNGALSPEFPLGHGNFGLSHGISGPLAVLSLALRRGIIVEGLTDAIARICAWTDAWRQDQPSGSWWPGFIRIEDVRRQSVRPTSRPRPSWCYGIPGQARTQQLAGIATRDKQRQRIAESAMLGCVQDEGQLARIHPDSGLCHGTAGVLHSAWRMAFDALTPEIANELPRVSARLISQLSETPVQAELLDGVTGAALALHTAGTNIPPESAWDACLLLA